MYSQNKIKNINWQASLKVLLPFVPNLKNPPQIHPHHPPQSPTSSYPSHPYRQYRSLTCAELAVPIDRVFGFRGFGPSAKFGG